MKSEPCERWPRTQTSSPSKVRPVAPSPWPLPHSPTPALSPSKVRPVAPSPWPFSLPLCLSHTPHLSSWPSPSHTHPSLTGAVLTPLSLVLERTDRGNLAETLDDSQWQGEGS